MSRFYAKFTMHGKAGKVAERYNSVVYDQSQGKHNCNAEFALQVRVKYPDLNGYYNYSLPSVTAGNRKEAPDHLTMLERQGRVDGDDADNPNAIAMLPSAMKLVV